MRCPFLSGECLSRKFLYIKSATAFAVVGKLDLYSGSADFYAHLAGVACSVGKPPALPRLGDTNHQTVPCVSHTALRNNRLLAARCGSMGVNSKLSSYTAKLGGTWLLQAH
eukprot:5388294-Amphidinium_carterae.1